MPTKHNGTPYTIEELNQLGKQTIDLQKEILNDIHSDPSTAIPTLLQHDIAVFTNIMTNELQFPGTTTKFLDTLIAIYQHTLESYHAEKDTNQNSQTQSSQKVSPEAPTYD